MPHFLRLALPCWFALAAPVAFAAPDLAGTWTLVRADVIRADGTRALDYGEAPRGRLHIDAQGRYALQIFDSTRPRFAVVDKQRGTAAEYRAAVLGASTHYGTLRVEDTVLHFTIEGASFPNWEGQTQTRAYEVVDGVLTYRVPPRPDGGVPISVWRRID